MFLMMDKASNGVNKEYGVYAGIGAVLIVVVVGLWWMRANQAPAATPSEDVTITTESDISSEAAIGDEVSVASSVPPAEKPPVQNQPATVVPYTPFTLVAGETVASWDFVGTHKDGGQLEAKVRADIARLNGLISTGEVSRYEVYVSLANQYHLLGDGGKEYEFLGYALAIDASHTGLAWNNMGKLLERLGAYKSARVAYDNMVKAQPTAQYLRARLEFLQAHMPEDTEAIAQAEAALAASSGQ